MPNCIFCKIISGEIPSYKVYEDEATLAFLDINPVNPGHTLVVPKKHVADIEEADEETLCLVMKVVKKVGTSLKNNLSATGYNFITLGVNSGSVAGQLVPHLHFHVIPRAADDGLKLWPQRPYQPGQAEAIMKKIKL